MVKTSEDLLDRQLREAAEAVQVGGRYQHYKGDFYRVVALAFEEASMEIIVVYQADYGRRITFTRPLAVWDESVQWQGEQIPRFRLAT
jgi:hypothetical protein